MGYESNLLEMTISDNDIGLVPRAVPLLDARDTPSGCSEAEGMQYVQALGQLIGVATLAAQEARFGSAARFDQFFHSMDDSTRSTVAARFDAVVRESQLPSTGATTYYCNDPFGYCDPDTLSYSIPSQNAIGNCPLYYTLSPLSRVCGYQDQTTTSLHELTHLPSVFTPTTQDFAFGVAASSQLSPDQAILNADTYAFYANCKS